MRDEYNNDKIYTIDEIKEISKLILSKFDFVDKAYLFGSYARNEQNKNSDLDIVIELVDEDDISQMSDFYCLSPRLESAFNKKVDTLTMTEAKNIMSRTFERDKVLIYEQRN